MTCLPNEILSYIFEHCLSSVRNRSRSVLRRDGWTHPLVLASICSEWRDIALSSAHLWTDILIPVYPIEEDAAFQRKMVASCLERSGILPLYLHIFQKKKSIKAQGNHPALDVLKAHVHRCRILHLEMELDLVCQLTGSGARFPLLEDFRVLTRRWQSEVSVDFLDFRTVVPLEPRKLTIDIQGPRVKQSTLCWVNLKVVSFAWFYAADLVPLLRSTPLLEEFKIAYLLEDGKGPRFLSSLASPVNHPPHCVHRNLKEISWLECSPGISHNIFNDMTLPSLEILVFADAYETTDRIVRSFFSRSSPPLHKMKWSRDGPLPSEEASFLKLCGQLEELEMTASESSSEGILNSLADDPDFLPRLTKLKITFGYLIMATKFNWYVIPRLFDGPSAKSRRNLQLQLHFSTSSSIGELEELMIPPNLIPTFKALSGRGVLTVLANIYNDYDPRTGDWKDCDFIYYSHGFHEAFAPVSENL